MNKGKIKILLSLIDYLKDNKNIFFKKGTEAYAFFRLYQELGGKAILIEDHIYLEESFEITLRLLNGEKIVLKEKTKPKRNIVIGASPYTIYSREHLASSISAAALCAKNTTGKYREYYPGYGEPGFKIKTKNWKNKIPKQKRKRRR